MRAVQTGEMRPLAEIGTELSRALQASPIAAKPAVAEPDAASLKTDSAPTSKPTDEGVPGAGPDWNREWRALEPLGHALRAGRLDTSDVFSYGRTLRELVTRYPIQVEIWEELLLVVISYEKNPADALEIAKEAHQRLPENTDLARLLNIIDMWAAERKND